MFAPATARSCLVGEQLAAPAALRPGQRKTAGRGRPLPRAESLTRFSPHDNMIFDKTANEVERMNVDLSGRRMPVRVLCLVLIAALLCSFPVPVRAEGTDMEPGGPVTFDGVELPSGALCRDSIPFVRLSEVAAALGVQIDHAEGSDEYGFAWRKDYVTLRSGSEVLHYLGEDTTLSRPTVPWDGGADLLVPVEGFCAGTQIGYLYDKKYDHIYCTPAAGDWKVPRGYNVPVFMYHSVSHGWPNDNISVTPQLLETQIKYLVKHGYTPIWFEDLEHVEDYEKPVILTFDDGWQNNYTNLLPLVKKYQVKVTIFMVYGYLDRAGGNHLSREEALEMYETGLVSFQSHMVKHVDLRLYTPEQQEKQMRRSRLYLTRLFGKEPCAMSYPYGGSNKRIEKLARQYYHFAVKMGSSRCYNTSDNPRRIYRFFPHKTTPMHQFKSWLKSAFPSS